jgi:diguanylate cyclase (GGDEF)-like protein/PAS domain S-box-containing protein
MTKKIDLAMKTKYPTKSWAFLRWFLTLFVPLFALAGGIVALFYFTDIRNVRFTFESDESRHLERQKRKIEGELKSIVSDLMVFSDDPRAKLALERGDADQLKMITDDLLAFLGRRERYDQVRLINHEGMEVSKIVYTDGKPLIVARDLLKSVREEIGLSGLQSLNRNEIFFTARSSRSEEEKGGPSSGVSIRMGIPFFSGGNRHLGALIFDYHGSNLVSILAKSGSRKMVQSMLLSGEGSDVGRAKTGDRVSSEVWEGVSEADSGQFYEDEGLVTFAAIYPLVEVQATISGFGKTALFGASPKNAHSVVWKILSYVPKEVLDSPSKLFLRKLVLFYLIFSLFLLVGAALLARIAVKRRVVETALQESDIQIRNIVSTTLDGIIITNDKGTVELFNPAAEKIFGYKSGEVLGESVNLLIPGPYRKEESEYLPHYLDSEERGVVGARREVSGQRKDGTKFPIELAVSEVRLNHGKLFTGVIRDITDRKEMEEQLRNKAFHDALTSLPNRSLLISRLERSIKLAKARKDYLFAVLFLDLDRFKVINDSLGHAVGDRLLIAIARRMERCPRPGDTVARLGGDELAILLEDVGDLMFARRVSERIHKEMELPFTVESHEIFITVSIGIALSSIGYDKPEDVLRDADIAMYRAKSLGKSRHEIFDKTMHNRAVALQQLETDLRRAVGQKEFELFYQPIVSLKSLKIIGFEALIRWNHPERGLILPDHFIPLAEETRLIVPIGHFVLQEACRQMYEWHQQFPEDKRLEISVNLSSKQFLQPNFVDRVKQVLGETSLGARSLRLEITESLLMEDADEVNAMLTELRRIDIQLDIDDFGTGYSSLSYLHRFPFNTLKIDKSFTSRIDDQGGKLELIRMIVALAHNFKMEVIVEGIERKEQLSQLKRLGCEYGQGYFFSKPVDRNEATALISKNAQVIQG